MAKAILESSHPFRQDAPLYRAGAIECLNPAIFRVSLNEKKVEPNSKKKGNKKKKPVFNKRFANLYFRNKTFRIFEKPPTKVVIHNDDSSR